MPDAKPSLREQWLDKCENAAASHTESKSGGPAPFYAGNRKIFRSRTLRFKGIDDSLQLADCGFTPTKLAQLRKWYLHEKSLKVATRMWMGVWEKRKYNSVTFHCFNHLMKGSGKRGILAGEPQFYRHGKDKMLAEGYHGVMGPCLLAVTLTYIDLGKYAVDVFYRSTELFKKFPADLVFLRDVLLEPFHDFDFKHRIESLTCHFANVTAHPMYWAGLMPLQADPVASLQKLRARDERFHHHVLAATSPFFLEERASHVAKFAQGRRLGENVLSRLTPEQIDALRDYMRANFVRKMKRAS